MGADRRRDEYLEQVAREAAELGGLSPGQVPGLRTILEAVDTRARRQALEQAMHTTHAESAGAAVRIHNRIRRLITELDDEGEASDAE